ncbi:MAG TPA: MBL fold metallo-hydrolase [Candidatus Atribacteria bacterium]|nr:MBL fold metallo-hydrolase [Candidatus Atribacteria bacterium]
MYIEQFHVPKIAHSSYLLGGKENCAIVDPRRDVNVYIEGAKRMGFKITHILETHLHADFVSGHLDLAEKTGAKIYIPASANGQFKHQPLQEGDEFKIDDVVIRVIETPGHTPEHLSYVVADESRGKEAVVVFCGDTLFVGDVGRPDLFPEKVKELASQLFVSLKKLKELPVFCEILPAHGAGSLCGRAMGAKRTSTIGYEKIYNKALQINSEEEFSDSLTHEMPPVPDHFGRCSDINRKGPKLVRNLDKINSLKPLKFAELAESRDYAILDCRSYDAFGGQHIIGSYGIDFDGNFPTFAGWVIPPEKKIILVTPSRVDGEEVAIWLRRVGLDNVVGFLEGGLFEWAKHGLPTQYIYQISAMELEHIRNNQAIHILDVRAPYEFKEYHIEGAINISAPDLRESYKELDKEKEYYVICSTGHRSSLAISILLQKGFYRLINVAGGMTGVRKFTENR